MSEQLDSFRLVQRHHTTAVVVELHGEFDVLSAASLDTCLHALTSVPDRDVVVDLRPATFIDCSTLGVLCGAHQRLRTDGRRLQVVVTRPLTLRVLRLLRLDHTFRVLDTWPPSGREANGRITGTSRTSHC
ncbi:STAS domain-containing protein [Streptomyces flavofungini]|uniref:STAS domain-containing protein n=1 Tax=Streptomyces flavofungini TaxID=68200 RepID=UPI0034DF8AF9